MLMEEQEEVLALIKASTSGGGGDMCDQQWSFQEISDLIAIKSQVDENGIVLQKMGKDQIWGLVSARMGEMGYCRSSFQCKTQWNNLVKQYKGVMAMENQASSNQEVRSNFPFFNQLHLLFMRRRQSTMQGMHSKTKVEYSDENEDTESVKAGEQHGTPKVQGKKRKADNPQQQAAKSKGSGGVNTMQEVLEEFMREQKESEMAWRRSIEEREIARRRKEDEWMKMMENIEQERIIMEHSWREKEEKRRAKDEALSQKRDSLITTLLTQLIEQDQL